MTPSPALLAHLRGELQRHEPFTRLRPQTLETLLRGARQTYHAPGELVLGPDSGVVTTLRWVRRGSIRAQGVDGEFVVDAGELFPVGAMLGRRAVTSRYEAAEDLFCLEFQATVLERLLGEDPVLADFLHRRLQHLLQLASRAAQASSASQVLAQQSFEQPLRAIARPDPLAVGAQTPLGQALDRMHERGVGSVLVVDEARQPLGILTRHDLLGRVVLRQPHLALDTTPIGAVMSQPVHTLEVDRPVHEAALLMSRLGVRHVPLVEGGKLAGIVSERDLFALQRLSLKSLGASLQQAPDVPALRALAAQVRDFARHLLAQGVAAATLTALISHLNDRLTVRLVELLAAPRGLSLARACWVAFGSEGRGEQTIATDQDNGLVIVDEADDAEVQRWREFGREVNLALDACGFPLCKGGVMAGEAACCLRQGQWLERFGRWMAQGEPEDLLNASIYFDARTIAGAAPLLAPLQETVRGTAPSSTRFLRLMAENSLRLRPGLAWHGGLQAEGGDGGRWLDLKMHGTAVFVDAARLFCLAHGVPGLGTRERLVRAGEVMGVPGHEREGWASAFEVLQMMRLRAQVRSGAPAAGNRIDLDTLDDIDRQLLKEAMKVARRVQQRLEMDWVRA